MGRTRTGLFAALLLAAVAAVAPACEQNPSVSANRSTTSTVTIEREVTLSVETDLAVDVLGRVGLLEIHASLDLTATATSLESAEQALDGFELQVSREEFGRLTLTTAQPMGASVGGQLVLEVPATMEIEIVSRMGEVRVTAMDRAINVTALSNIQIEGARDGVVADAQTGSVTIESTVPPGSELVATTNQGNVELVLPFQVSARIEASAENGQISILHGALPPLVGARQNVYQANVNGGLAYVQAVTRSGNVILRSP